MKNLFGDSKLIRIHQIREFMEIAIGWETANKYEVLLDDGRAGYAAERKRGILGALTKNLLKSHRPLTVDVWDADKKLVLTGRRPFYFFFSDLVVKDDNGAVVGEIKTRFGVIKRKYDLLKSTGAVFARIESPRWKLWTFFIKDRSGADAGKISKKWGGVFKEIFSDSDSFAVDVSQRQWSDNEKAVLLFAALSIDLDFFEENSSSVLNVFD